MLYFRRIIVGFALLITLSSIVGIVLPTNASALISSEADCKTAGGGWQNGTCVELELPMYQSKPVCEDAGNRWQSGNPTDSSSRGKCVKPINESLVEKKKNEEAEKKAKETALEKAKEACRQEGSIVVGNNCVDYNGVSKPLIPASDPNPKADDTSAGGGGEGDGEEDSQSSCGIAGIGWIVCPVMGFLGSVADMAFNFLADSFLSINSDYVTSTSIENAWGVMRTLANVVFVIAFLVIIFSQLTSTGISNYGVKKLLPRLIIAAVLVNMSLIICQLAVDVSNILGYSLKTVFEALGNNIITPREDPTGVSEALAGLGWATVITALLVGTITLALAISGPVLLAAVLALLLIAIILVARIALIVTLTIISPLAFVAFLLPNTEQWFKKWYKMFFALLLVFPVIAVVFGASSLVAEIINETANADPDNPNLLMQVIAMGVATVPLFLVPGLLKNSMSAAGALGNKLAGWSSKANGRIGSKVRDTSRLGEAQRGLKNRMALRRATRRGKSRFQRAIDNSWAGKQLGLDKGAAAAMSAVDEQDEKDVKQELTRFRNTNGATDTKGAAAAMKDAIEKGDSVKARAMQRYLTGAGSKGVKELEQVYSESSEKIRAGGTEGIQKSLASDALALGMKGKSAAIDSFSTSEKGDFNKIRADTGTYSRLGASELAGQKNLAQLMTAKGAPVLDAEGKPVLDADKKPILGLGTVSPEMAEAVMSSPDARDLMSVHDLATMANLAGTNSGGNPSSGGAPATTGGGSAGGSSIPPVTGGTPGGGFPGAPSSGGSSGGSAPSSGGSAPAGYTQSSSGFLVPNGGAQPTSSQPAASSSSDATVLSVNHSTPQQTTPTSHEEEAAAAAAESRPKVVDKRAGARAASAPAEDTRTVAEKNRDIHDANMDNMFK